MAVLHPQGVYNKRCAAIPPGGIKVVALAGRQQAA